MKKQLALGMIFLAGCTVMRESQLDHLRTALVRDCGLASATERAQCYERTMNVEMPEWQKRNDAFVMYWILHQDTRIGEAVKAGQITPEVGIQYEDQVDSAAVQVMEQRIADQRARFQAAMDRLGKVAAAMQQQQNAQTPTTCISRPDSTGNWTTMCH